MKRLAFLIIVITSILTLIPVYALERNVWTYSASAEICFETVPLSTLTNNYVEEELIAPVDEETDEEFTSVEEERTESTSTSLDEALALVDESDEDLIDEDIALPVDEQIDELDFIAVEQTELTTPVEETEFVDESDKELTDEN